MFKNYILMGFRRIKSSIASSIVAIISLSLGITTTLIFYNFISHQLSYDEFIGKRDIKRFVLKESDKNFYESNSIYSLSPSEVEDIRSEAYTIEGITELSTSYGMGIEIDNEYFFEDLMFIDKSFFDVIPIKDGDKKPELKRPDSALIDRVFAKKFFPDGDYIGKEILLKYGSGYTTIIEGVVDIPEKSHLYNSNGVVFMDMDVYKGIIEYSGIEDNKNIVYIESREGFSEEDIIRDVSRIIDKRPLDENIVHRSYLLEDFKDIYLFPGEYSFEELKPLYLVYFLGAVTLAILLVSIINSVSVLTSQFINRGKEVGVRLIMGSGRRSLLIQFVVEAIILTSIAGLLSLIFAELLMPFFSVLVNFNLNFSYDIYYIFFIITIVIVVGSITGLYPLFYLSSLKPTESLKGKRLIKLGKFKKITIINQFIFSSILLISSIIINNEVKKMEKVDTGIDSERIIYIYPGYDLNKESRAKTDSLKSELLKLDSVINVSYSALLPFWGGLKENYIKSDIRDYFAYVDRDYFDTLGLKTIKGNIRENTIVLLKSILEYREWNIGDIVEIDGKSYEISAVIDDYLTHTPLFIEETPRIHIVSPDEFYFLIIKTDENCDIGEIKELWKSILPNRGFEYSFLNRHIEDGKSPKIVKTIKKIMNIALYISVFISILGLFGITLQNIMERSKEIGIRKVLGAGFTTIVRHFYLDSLKLILPGVIIGIPLGFLIISLGLGSLGYPYIITNPVGNCILSSIIITGSGSVIVLLMILNFAFKNPSGALRYE